MFIKKLTTFFGEEDLLKSTKTIIIQDSRKKHLKYNNNIRKRKIHMSAIFKDNFLGLISLRGSAYIQINIRYVSITHVVLCWLEIRHWDDKNNIS